MEEVPDRVADGVDHPETIIFGDKVFVSHDDGSLRERFHTDKAVFVRDVTCRHRIHSLNAATKLSHYKAFTIFFNARTVVSDAD